MNRAVVFGFVGAALAASLLLGLPSAYAETRCKSYTHVRANQYARISTTSARVCSVEVSGGPGHASIVDSPDGTGTHGQARFVSEPRAGTGLSYSTGEIDRVTEFGLAVESSNVDVFVSWEKS